jgi:hypothetical protein
MCAALPEPPEALFAFSPAPSNLIYRAIPGEARMVEAQDACVLYDVLAELAGLNARSPPRGPASRPSATCARAHQPAVGRRANVTP